MKRFIEGEVRQEDSARRGLLKQRLREIGQKGWASALNESSPSVGSFSCAVGDPVWEGNIASAFSTSTCQPSN